MKNYNLYFFATTFLLLWAVAILPAQAQVFPDTLESAKIKGNVQAAALPNAEKTLEEMAQENALLLSQPSFQQLPSPTLKTTPDTPQNESLQKQSSTQKKILSEKQIHKHKQKSSKGKKLQKKQKKQRSWGGLHLNFKWIELDWFMIGLVIALFMGLMILLYFLFVGNTLSFFEMLLFAMGFGFAIFSFIFLSSEADGGRAAYEFFIKYGVFSWAGIMAIIAGFAGLFGSTVNLGAFILIGLVLGGIAFVLSLLLGDHLFMGYDQRKRN